MLDQPYGPERERDMDDYARFVLDAFGAADYELNLQTGALRASHRFNELYGYPADHPLTLAEYVAHQDPADRDALDVIVGQATAQEQTHFQREFRILLLDSTTRWVLSRDQVVFDDAGRPLLLRGAALDITERKQAEARLAISAASDAFRVRLGDTLRPLADPIAIQAEATRVLGEHLHAHRVAYFEVSGFDYVVERDYMRDTSSLRGRYPTEAFGPQILAAYRAGRVLVCHDVQTDPLLSPSQRAAHIAIQIGAFIGVPLVKDGQFVAGLTVHQAIPRTWTDDEVALVAEVAEHTLAAVTQARAEAALRASEEKYRTLFSSIDEGFCIIEVLFDDAGTAVDYRFLEVNPAFAHQTGLADTVGRTVRELVSDHEAAWFAQYGQIAQSGESLRFQQTSHALGREYDVYAFRVGAPDEHRVAVLFTDITERVRTEAALRESETRLRQLYAKEQAARAVAEEAGRVKDEFLATVSHELRTPLTALMGYAELLQRRKRDETYVAHAVAKIRQSAQAQAQLIEDLLDISRIVSGKLKLTPEPVQLADVIVAAVDTVHPMLDAKRIRLDLDLSPAVVSVMGDPHRLQQVLWNLLTNAGKFTPAGGAVTVRLEQDEHDARVTVSDTGQGIAEDFLAFVFDRFRQEDGRSQRSHGGLGLGLAIVRHLVELHGGAVTAASAGLGQGATFTVRLPLVHQRVTWGNAAEAERDDRATELAGLRVLVVDDQPAVLEMLAELLAADGAEVEACAAAADALTALRAAPPDVLISDIAMPERDGYWLIEEVRRLPPESGGAVPAIALTAYVQLEDRLRVLAAGYQQYVPKPVDSSELRDVIHALTAPDGSSGPG